MKKSRYLSYLAIVLLLSNLNLSAQGLYKVPLEEKLANASFIFEGKVTSQESFWNTQHTMIFTSNKIDVYKVFKGALVKSSAEVITNGGSVDNVSIDASDLLQLNIGETGVFFCSPNRWAIKSPSSNEVLMDVYSSSQGFFSYDLKSQQASAPFVRYSSIVNELYTVLQQKIGRAFENKRPDFKADGPHFSPNGTNAPSITGFSPATVNAGALIDPANNELTITGTGFGTATGSAAVSFDDADNGTGGTAVSIAATSPLIVSWSDTEIKIKVPTKAGTGTFSVTDASGTSANSPSALNVLYSMLTSSFASGTVIRESNLMNDNGSGGYSILYSTNTAGRGINFDAAAEKATFQRALTTWREISGINFSEAGTTTTQAVASDGINIAVFDNDNAGVGVTPLPSGVLAVCYSYNSLCISGSYLAAQKTEFDVIIRSTTVSSGTTSFTSGPCPPMSSNFNDLDLETVILHELGHALNLGHINDSYQGTFAGEINPGKLMNFAVVNSVKRATPDYSAASGATYSVTPQGNVYGSCGLSGVEMTPLATTTEPRDECPGTFPSTPTAFGTAINFDLVHATSNKLVDPGYNQVNTALDGIGITNTAFYAFRTDATGGVLSLVVSGYSTTPSTLTSCTDLYGSSYPTKGVELALYQANSCPTAQSYPTPVAYRTFNANGSITDISGLSGNTTYLLVFDGIENTKANFTINFVGSALPVSFTEFAGIANTNNNLLTWKYASDQAITNMTLEKGTDGHDFQTVADVTNLNTSGGGKYSDYQPLAGNNYYRLVIKKADGTKLYSKVVLLKRKNDMEISVYPNPARKLLNIRTSSIAPTNFYVTITNTIGQNVINHSFSAGGLSVVTPIDITKLSKGIYLVSLQNAQKEIISTTKIVVE